APPRRTGGAAPPSPAVRDVDDEPAPAPRAVEDEHPERQPRSHADRDRRLPLERAGERDLLERGEARDVHQPGGVRGRVGRAARGVVGGDADDHLQVRAAGHRHGLAGPLGVHDGHVAHVPAVDVAAHVEHEAVVAGVTPRAHTRESGVGGRAGVALGERAPRDAAVRRGVRRRARRDEEQGAQQHCEHPCEEALHGLLLRRAARAGGVVSDARNRRAVEEEPRRSRFGHLRIVGVRTVAARRRRGRGRPHVRGTASPTLQDAGYRERGPGGGADRRTKTRRTAPERRDEECDVPTLKANELYLTYGDGYVFDGLSIEISSGQPPVGLIGPSGVGKTTLNAALSGQLKPPRGTVTFDGRPVARLRMRSKAEFNARVSAVSQYSMTISDPRMTAERRLRDAMKVARKGGRSHATPLPEMLAAVGLDAEKAYRPMVTLSGGERQRVALAAALATRPEILLLD